GGATRRFTNPRYARQPFAVCRRVFSGISSGQTQRGTTSSWSLCLIFSSCPCASSYVLVPVPPILAVILSAARRQPSGVEGPHSCKQQQQTKQVFPHKSINVQQIQSLACSASSWRFGVRGE